MILVIIIAILLIIIFLLLAFFSYIHIDINNYNIKDNKIDKNIKIILLSDLHNRNLIDKLNKIIKTEQPDMIFMSGDMVNEKLKYISNFLRLCNTLKDYNVYYTFGNHEEQMNKEDKEKYYELLSKTKINILNNKYVDLSNNIRLYGFDCDYSSFKGLKKESIISSIGIIDEEKYNIMIAHNPLEAKIYSLCNIDLTLSGHIHGGLIKLPFVGALFSPNYKFFPKYYEGIYNVNNMRLVVSRGLGFCRKIPFRILNPGEVVIINIMKNE